MLGALLILSKYTKSVHLVFIYIGIVTVVLLVMQSREQVEYECSRLMQQEERIFY
jgi:hypothetical protein